MASINYKAEAELFPSRRRYSGKGPVGYKRFKSAAEAIRFAIGSSPGAASRHLSGSWRRAV
jgi:hypothetical protein